MSYLFAYFLKHVAFFSFCLFLALLIKRSAFTLGFIFVWFLGENVGHAILKYNILGYTPKDKDTVVIDWIKDVLPLESMSNLIVEPLTRLNLNNDLFTKADFLYNCTTKDLLSIFCIFRALFVSM